MTHAHDIDPLRLVSTLRDCVAVDSPVGYAREAHEWLDERLSQMGYVSFRDAKSTTYVRVRGEDPSRLVCVGAHMDTVGLVVRGVNADGTLRVRQLGGINYSSIEGETCRVHCRDGRVVAGQVICSHHSVHVWGEAKTDPRDEDTMAVSLVADVRCPEDVRELGICPGAVVAVDPHFDQFDNGYLVSRHIDDKAGVAVILDVLRWWAETGERPAYDTLLAFPMYEEIGHGGSFVPSDVDEYVALDISLIGPDYDSDEHQVGVICADRKGPYDWDLTNVLLACAESACTRGRWNAQVCYRYTTDANAAYTGANDLRAAAFGMACLNTHGRERCHVDALVETERLLRAYLAGEGRGGDPLVADVCRACGAGEDDVR